LHENFAQAEYFIMAAYVLLPPEKFGKNKKVRSKLHLLQGNLLCMKLEYLTQIFFEDENPEFEIPKNVEQINKKFNHYSVQD
jgi:hypothetical protein